MNKLNAEILNITEMASGHLCLDITEKINWEDFPEYANNLVNLLKGKLLSKVDATDIRIWDVSFNNYKYRLTFEDYPLMLALESTDNESSNEISNIRDTLLKLRSEK